MLKPFEDLLLYLLKFFYTYTGSYGWAIVLLTIFVKILLLPLTIKQTRAMLDAPKVQAKIKEIQTKHKDDNQKMQEELMKFYKENKIDPFGGCLPLLFQLPVFWALFFTLRTYSALKGASFYWLKDLSLSISQNRHINLKALFNFTSLPLALSQGWPYYLLLVSMGLTTYFSQKMVTAQQEPAQKSIMVFMNLFLVYIAYILPAGVLLYWITMNFLTILQQYIQLKLMADERGKAR